MISIKHLIDITVSSMPQLIGLFTGLLGSIIMARTLGPEGMGKYTLIMSILGMAISLSDLGVNQTTIRNASNAISNGHINLQEKILRASMRIRLVMSIIVTFIFIVLFPYVNRIFWQESDITEVVRVGLVGTVIAALSSTYAIYFQSRQKYIANSIVASIQKIISFIALVLMVFYTTFSLFDLILVNLMASTISALIFMSLIPIKTIWSMEDFSKSNISKLFQLEGLEKEKSHHLEIKNNEEKFLIPYLIITIVSTVTSQLDSWLIANQLGAVDLGIYSVATRFALPISILFGAITTVFWPYTAGIVDRQRLKSLLDKVLKTGLILLIILFFYSVVAPMFSEYIFGQQYAKSTVLAQVLCIKATISIIHGPVAIIGYNLGLVKKVVLITFLQLLLIIIFNLILMPYIGSLATALSMLLSEILALFVMFIFVVRKIEK